MIRIFVPGFLSLRMANRFSKNCKYLKSRPKLRRIFHCVSCYFSLRAVVYVTYSNEADFAKGHRNI